MLDRVHERLAHGERDVVTGRAVDPRVEQPDVQLVAQPFRFLRRSCERQTQPSGHELSVPHVAAPKRLPGPKCLPAAPLRRALPYMSEMPSYSVRILAALSSPTVRTFASSISSRIRCQGRAK